MRATIPGQGGFTLIEFIVSLGLGISLLSGVLAMFVQTHRSATQDRAIAGVLENGRFLMRFLEREVSMSGFWGGFIDESEIAIHPSVSIGRDCGAGGVKKWAVQPVSLEFLNDVSPADVAASFECLPAADVRAKTDIIATRRTVDMDTVDAEIVANQIYLRTDAGRAELFLGAGEGTPPLLNEPQTNWALVSQVFYVRDYSIVAGDNLPAFCRAYLDASGPPDMRNECLVEGVENLQLEFGVDTDDDWTADYYDPDPTDAEILKSVSIRVHVLVRSVERVPGYINDKSYALGQFRLPAANDGFYRRVFSSTVLLRNAAGLVGIDR